MVGGRPLRVLAYVRVSTTEQGDRGTSLETQREEIERFCAAQGFPAPEVFVEVESAGETKIERRLALARRQADHCPAVHRREGEDLPQRVGFEPRRG